MTFVPTTKADLDDKRWLDDRIEALRDGIEAARDIWLNWDSGREVKRFAEGQSYGDFIKARLGYALPLAEVLQIMPGASTREVAKVAGVSHMTVARERSGVTNVTPAQPEAPATVLGSDGKKYPAKRVEVMVPTNGTTTPVTSPKPSLMTRRMAAFAGTPVAKLGKVEVRDRVKMMRLSMSILRPDNTVPGAQQQVFDLLPDVEAWLATWKAVAPKP